LSVETRGVNVNYEIKVQPQKRNNLVIRTSPGVLEVLIPDWLHEDSPQVKQFIQAGIQRFGDRVPPKAIKPIPYQEIKSMVQSWAICVGVMPKRVQMRTMNRKWGSCSRRGTITFDTAVYHLPYHLVEYLICHELVHLLEFNHGPEFCNLMSLHMPDWQERKRELTGFEHFR
jgi:predicted metal-dependent hydrolase